jgi:hypothetical protein
MAQKNWVDIEAFIEAFAKALKLHAGRFKGTVDPAKFSESIAKARHEATRTRSSLNSLEAEYGKVFMQEC